MKTALYLRVSDPDKGQTTDNQLAQLEEWCEHKVTRSRRCTATTNPGGGGARSAATMTPLTRR
jgi:DNA invertase Pin-like site-specific DNA recombinase